MISYRCPRGHEQGYWHDAQITMAIEAGKDPEFLRCDRCPGKRRMVRLENPRLGVVIFDIPEHFNMSFGEKVRSRKHLQELQKKNGCRDWEPVKEMPQTSRLKRMGLL